MNPPFPLSFSSGNWIFTIGFRSPNIVCCSKVTYRSSILLCRSDILPPPYALMNNSSRGSATSRVSKCSVSNALKNVQEQPSLKMQCAFCTNPLCAEFWLLRESPSGSSKVIPPYPGNFHSAMIQSCQEKLFHTQECHVSEWQITQVRDHITVW